MVLLLGVYTLAGAQQNAGKDPAPPSMIKTVKFKVTGMTCGGCANHISTALQKLDGVIDEDVEYPGDVAIVKFDPKRLNEKKIIQAIEGAGYKAQVLKSKPNKGKQELL